jgi:hypothetical protein
MVRGRDNVVIRGERYREDWEKVNLKPSEYGT